MGWGYIIRVWGGNEMISAKIIKNADYYFGLNNPHSTEYYHSENGYDEVWSYWIGGLAKERGMLGESVKKEDLDAFLNLKKQRKNSRVGVDLCFSAPKAVSVLWLFDEEIEHAHMKAVAKANKFVLENFVKTRLTKNKKTEIVKGDTAVACFNHYFSRELDVNLHTHCLYLNLVHTGNGKYGALEAEDFLEKRHEIDMIYKEELVKELRKLGYDARIVEKKAKIWEKRDKYFDIEISNMPVYMEKAKKAFSTRRRKILEEMEKNGLEKSKRKCKIADNINMATRPAKTTRIKKEEIKKILDVRLKALGLSLQILSEMVKGIKQRQVWKQQEQGQDFDMDMPSL